MKNLGSELDNTLSALRHPYSRLQEAKRHRFSRGPVDRSTAVGRPRGAGFTK